MRATSPTIAPLVMEENTPVESRPLLRGAYASHRVSGALELIIHAIQSIDVLLRTFEELRQIAIAY